ncbi:hypothetical protein CK203_045731 [Vitis vinifera]|uniref:Uncharacterized protein n=1 Tax=Vitis vinifera TaxID=29760 RepID=A0A438I118_VITVI|nr:hypothetical protein CK203_045731 [Vitis vinifera]
MEEAKTMKTPMSSSIKIDLDEKGKPVNSTMYRDHFGQISDRLQVMDLILGRLEVGFDLNPGFQLLGVFNLCIAHLKVGSASSPRETGTSRAQGKRPAEPYQPEQTEAHRNERYDTTLFSSIENYQCYNPKFAQRKVVLGRNVNSPNFSTSAGLPDSGVGFLFWVTYGLGGPILSTVRGIKIKLSPESICRILDIPLVGLRVYEAKTWPTMPGFKPREVVQSRVLHHMICSILLPHGGHRDEVSYLEAFIVGLDPHRETDSHGISDYDAYDLLRPELDIPPPPQSEGIHVEATFSEPMMTESSFTTGPSSQPSFTELPSQALHALDMRLGWMSPLILVPLGLVWRSTWISIRLESFLGLITSSNDLSAWRSIWIINRPYSSLSNRALIVLRVVRRVSMRR